MSLVGHLTYPYNLNDVWAYVDGNGNEYALVGTTEGLSIVSLQDPANPTELQFIPGASSTWRDMVVYQHYAYVSNETDNGTLIIDLSTLPGTVVYKDTVLAGIFTAHNLWRHDRYLYQVGMNTNNGGMAIFSLVDPWRPTFVGAYDERYIHDVYFRGDTAYAAEINQGFLTIIDIRDKTNPVVIGQRDYENSFTHNTWLSDDGRTCFTTDELSDAYLYSWDVSDPSDIRFQDRIRSSLSNGEATPHNTHVLNDFLITSYYKDGINIVDATYPYNLIEVGYYDTSPMTGGGTDGCWGAYPYLPSGYVLASDMNEGFFVLSASYTAAAYLEGVVTDFVTGNPIANADIQITGLSQQEFSNTSGFYATGSAAGGTYSVTFSKFGYITKTEQVTLTNGVLTTLDVQLERVPSATLEIITETPSGMPVPNGIVQFSTGPNQLDYVTGSNGTLVEPAVPLGTYTVLYGAWGYQTTQTTVDVQQNTSQVVLTLDPGYYDDFVFDFGWMEQGNASTGNWEMGDPVGTYAGGGGGGGPSIYNPEDDVVGDFGLNAYVTGNSGGNVGNDDIDDGITNLTSPIMDLSGYPDPYIQYSWWFVNQDFGGDIANDYLAVELWSGGNSVEIARYEGVHRQWTEETIRVRDFMTPAADMQIRFISLDQAPGNITEAAIDLFRVLGEDTTQTSTGLTPVFEAQNRLEVFPVPMEDVLNVVYELDSKFAVGELSLELVNMTGQVVHAQRLPSHIARVQLHMELPEGVYMLALKHNDIRIATHKVVK